MCGLLGGRCVVAYACCFGITSFLKAKVAATVPCASQPTRHELSIPYPTFCRPTVPLLSECQRLQAVQTTGATATTGSRILEGPPRKTEPRPLGASQAWTERRAVVTAARSAPWGRGCM